MAERAQWKSQFGFLAAAVGSAVGLGNIWRFSYKCYENGGGAFLVPYIVALLVAGVPLMILEFGLGHRKQGSAPKSLHLVAPHWEWVGWYAVVFVMFGIMFYYSVVMGWCVNYFVFSMDLRWGDDPNNFFFQNFLRLTDDPSNLGMISPAILYATGLIWFVSWLICYREVSHGIERACKVFIPVLLLLTTILVVWSLTLPGAGEGVKHYLKPDWGKIFWEKDWYKVWIDAFGQIFFTLSLGFGIMIAYASYLGKKSNLVKLAVQTSLINCFYSFFAGFAVFGTLGYMSQALDKPIQEVVASGPGLAFVAYPQAISLLPAGREIFGMVFFFVLILAGLSSGVSIIEAFSSAAQDKFGIPRKPLMTVLCFIGFIGSSLFTTQAGLLWLDIVDHFLNIYGLVVVGLLECLIIGWLYKNQPLRDHVDRLSKKKWSWLWFFCVKYLAPVVLLIILIQNFWSEIHEPYGGYDFIAIIVLGFGWIVMTLFIGIAFSLLPWRTQLKRPEEIYGEFAEGEKEGD